MSEPIQTPPDGTEFTEETPAIEPQEPETPQTPPVEEQPEGAQPEGQGTEQTPSQQSQVDYKDKFVHSQREAILQNARLKQKDAQLSHLTSKDTPTDDEMRSLYTWWDAPNVDDSTRDFYREQVARDKKLRATESLANAALQKLEFSEKLDDFVEEPPAEFKRLKGKEAEFKRFAKRKDNIGLPLDTLAKAFLFDASEDAPPVHAPVKTPGLENGTGGPRQAPKPKKLSLEDARELRKTNFEEYRRLSLAGMIEEEEF